MDIYLSYKHIDFYNKKIWEPDSIDKKNTHINFLKLNFFLLKKYFTNIYLITDKQSLCNFENLSWSNVYCILNDLEKEYLNYVPVIFKLYAYNFAANQEKPFLHLDNDFFILDQLDDNFLKSEAVAQSIDLAYSLDILYQQNYIQKYCLNKYHFCNELFQYHNCGIIGGNNLNFLKEYSKTAIDFVLDKNNKNFWTKNTNDLSGLSKSVIAEQVYYSCCAKKFNIKINLISNKKYLHKWIHPYGFFKYDNFKEIEDIIINKINSP
jgi:hypothetical protein